MLYGWLRSVAVTHTEWSDRLGFDPQHAGNPDDMAFAYQRRWKTVWEARRRFDADLLATEALWDDALREPVEALDTHLRTLYFHVFARYLRSLRDEPYRKAIQKDWEKTEPVIWADVDPHVGDSFADEFAATVKRFDAALKPHLRR